MQPAIVPPAIAPRETNRVAVIGLGLIGGSIALRCLKRGLTVVGYDADAATRFAANQRFRTETSIAAAVNQADLIVLAVPLKAMASAAQEVASAIDPGATVTDVGSVKAPILAAIKAAGLAEYYVGGHPMAGNEHSGFAAADPMLLVGAPWALTDKQNTRRYHEVYHWVTDTFDASVAELDDAEHDQIQALTSGLPHVLAVELLNQMAASSDKKEAKKLTAGSFRDGTRVAYTDPERTMALITENAEQVASLLQNVAQDLAELADQLRAGQDVSGFFHQADSLRAERADAANT